MFRPIADAILNSIAGTAAHRSSGCDGTVGLPSSRNVGLSGIHHFFNLFPSESLNGLGQGSPAKRQRLMDCIFVFGDRLGFGTSLFGQKARWGWHTQNPVLPLRESALQIKPIGRLLSIMAAVTPFGMDRIGVPCADTYTFRRSYSGRYSISFVPLVT